MQQDRCSVIARRAPNSSLSLDAFSVAWQESAAVSGRCAGSENTTGEVFPVTMARLLLGTLRIALGVAMAVTVILAAAWFGAHRALSKLDIAAATESLPLNAAERATLFIASQVFPLRQPAVITDGGRAGERFRDCDICPEMVVLPPGRALVGSPWLEIERYGHLFFGRGLKHNIIYLNLEGPRRLATISDPIAMSVTEVTVAEWLAAQADPEWEAITGHPSAPLPVEGADPARAAGGLDWYAANAYTTWLSVRTGEKYRLPTEVEWEYAARAGTATPFFWGDVMEPGRAQCAECEADGGREFDGPQPVGQFPPNAFGLHDMHGNVWEWVEDCFTNRIVASVTDGSAMTGGDCEFRSLRGGSASEEIWVLRSAKRLGPHAINADRENGIRIVREL